MKQAISSFIPEREEKVNLQVRVKKSLHEEVEKLLDQQGITWVKFIEASFSAYLTEQNGKK